MLCALLTALLTIATVWGAASCSGISETLTFAVVAAVKTARSA
jgi:hypothetical protein